MSHLNKKALHIGRIPIVFALLATGVSNTSCGKNSGPTTPILPNNFQIVSIENYGSTEFGSFGVNIFVSNNTDTDATLAGTFYFGDGASKKVEEITTNPAGWILSAKTTGSPEIGRFNHDYASLGTYRVKAELTVQFKNESISRTLEKDFTLTRD